MQHLTALAIEGAVLDADEDWLRDMAGLLRHGRCVAPAAAAGAAAGVAPGWSDSFVSLVP
jgi:hypothetical protein